MFSQLLLDELQEVARRDKFRRLFNEDALQELLNNLDEHCDFVNVTSQVAACRDVDDDYLLALSRDGGAHYLLTGDKDLLSLENFEGIRICTLTDFLNEHSAR